GSNTSYVQSAGAGAFGLLLWALLSGAVLGALGGMYQTSTVKAEVSRFLAFPLVLLSKPGYSILDRLRGQTGISSRNQARTLLYSAFLCVLVLTIVAGIVGGSLIALNQIFTIDHNIHIRDSLSVILIALPGLLLICSCAAALCSDPVLEGQSNTLKPALQF